MYFEELARITADHLRDHIEAYLDEVATQYTDGVNLIVPKSISATSVVGGLWNEFDSILPQYGVDVLGKVRSSDDSSLWTYEYPGQVNGMVSASSAQTADKLVWRHAWAVETFLRQHQYLHQPTYPGFSILELITGSTDLSGAEDLSQSDIDIWVAGFSINVSWFTSEDGPGQHV